MKRILVGFCLSGLVWSASGADVWNAKSNFGGVARHRGSGVAIGNRGYLGLGHFNGSGTNILFQDWWEFDPGTNSWSQKADYPFPTYAASQFVIGMKCYVGTGVSAGTQFYSFDPIANTWTPVSPVPAGATDQIGFAVNGKGYYLYFSQLYEYDPLMDNWTLKNNPPFTPSSWCSSFTIGDKAYVKTGSSLYEYKSSTDTWTARAPFPGLATGGSAAFSIHEKGYIVCGYSGWLSEVTDEVWEFDPAINVWTPMEEFPGTARRYAAGFAIGEKGYVGIGTNGTNMRDFWEFDEYLNTEDETGLTVQVYPNPSSGPVQLIIPAEYQASGYLILYNSAGQVVYEDNELSNVITVSPDELGSGLFIFSLSSKDSPVIYGKFVLN